MKKLLPFLLLCSLLVCCQRNNTVQIPDVVLVSKTPDLELIPGTRLLIYKPAGYTLITEPDRLKKDENTVLQVSEVVGTSYDERKETIKTAIEEAQKNNSPEKPFYHKEFRLGGYNAIFVYGHDIKPGHDQMVMYFGDPNFVVMAKCVFLSNSTKDRDTLLKTLLSMYIDDEVREDTTVLSTYTVDVSGTDFKYSGTAMQCDFYTLPGEGVPTGDTFQNLIFVKSFPAMGYEAIKKFADEMVDGYKNKVEISSVLDGQVMINGNNANEKSFSGTLKGRPCVGYQIVVSNKQHSVLFFGTAFDRRDKLMAQIRKIGWTMRIKE